MNRAILSLLALLGTLSFAQAQSALRWDSKTLEFHPAASEKTVRAEFGFTNTAPQPVVIGAVKSSCGCTTVSLDKKVYAPGEKGRITGVFTPGRRQGVLTKAISVSVKGESKPTVLIMVTHLGEK